MVLKFIELHYVGWNNSSHPIVNININSEVKEALGANIKDPVDTLVGK